MSPRGGGGSNRPTPGREYVVKRTDDGGEYMEDIGVAATGKTGAAGVLPIWAANPQLTPTKTKLPAGTKLVIPGGTAPPKVSGKAPYDVTCVIGGKEIPLLSVRILRTMDTGTDAWSARIAWTPGADPTLDHVTRPFGYQRAAVFIGNALQINGRLYTVAPELTDRGRVKGLVGYSYTVDAVDSSVMPPYEVYGLGLKQLANYYCQAMGIEAIFTPEVADDKDFMAPFTKATAQEGERIFDHLAKLAAQRGGLVSCTPEGNLLFLRAAHGGKPVGTLREGEPMVTDWRAIYDGRKRWHVYKIITAGVKGRNAVLPVWESTVTSGKQLSSTISELDGDVPFSRFQTFRADDVTPGNIHHAARWKRNKCFADALTTPLPVDDWYAPNGKVWEPNTLVTVVSPTLGVPTGFDFLIRSVEFELDDKGRKATLNLVPPQAFTGKDLGEIWK